MMPEVPSRRCKLLLLHSGAAPAADPPAPTAADAAPIGSRIEAPQPPPIDRRGGNALAFGVLRAEQPAAEPPLAEIGVGEDGAEAGVGTGTDTGAGAELPQRPGLMLRHGWLG